MKTIEKILYYSFVLIGTVLILFINCTKEEVDERNTPVLSTDAVTAITQISATSGGNITDDGGAEITARGVCWSRNETPTVEDNKTADGTGDGSFISYISGLKPNITYYIRAYATNSEGTGYGNTISFTTLVEEREVVLPTLTTTDITEITQTTAISGGNITDDGGAAVTARGVCWSTNEIPTIEDNKTIDGTGVGSFISHITGLMPNTTYHVRAYATNSEGTGYGDAISFTTTYSGALDDMPGENW